MDSILISHSQRARDGLADMIETAIGPHEIVQMFVPIQWALFIVRLAEDGPGDHQWSESEEAAIKAWNTRTPPMHCSNYGDDLG